MTLLLKLTLAMVAVNPPVTWGRPSTLTQAFNPGQGFIPSFQLLFFLKGSFEGVNQTLSGLHEFSENPNNLRFF